MAYGNWGAIVRLDGERKRESEDATCEGTTYHALLGHGHVLLCAYKHNPALLVEGAIVDLDPYLLGSDRYGNSTWAGVIDGHVFRMQQYDGNMIDLYLKEPDSGVWTATCGYMFGAGHIDEEGR